MANQKYSVPIQSFDPDTPQLDDGQLAGSMRVLADVAARDALPSAKRKIGAIISYTDTGVVYTKIYNGPDVTDTEWQKGTNWVSTAVYNEAETVNRTIYVTTTGSDTTGDGTIGSPFATIGKALSTIKKVVNSGVTITINIGIGGFTVSANDLNILSQITGVGDLIFQGQIVLIDTGFTIGAALAADPVTYNVSGGNTGTWTLNQWKFYFLKSGTSYYPITGNALTPTLGTVLSGLSGAGEIYQMQSVINMSYAAGYQLVLNIQTEFNSLTFNNMLNMTVFTANTGKFNARNCLFNNATAASLTFGDVATMSCRHQVRNCSFNLIRPLINSSSNIYSLSFISTNVNGGAITIQSKFVQDLTNMVFENPSTSSNAGGLRLSSGEGCKFSLASNIKFLNCNVALAVVGASSVDATACNIIFSGVNYFFRKSSASTDFEITRINFYTSVFYGAPVTRWFFDAMYEFVNLITGRSILVKNIIYPEYEQNLSATLTNNTTTQIIVGNKLQNKSMKIDYTITRGTGYRSGSFTIINDGSALTMSADSFIDNADAGVDEGSISFTVNYNTNEIRLAVLLDNGVAGTFVYNVSRVMITPLTI